MGADGESGLGLRQVSSTCRWEGCTERFGSAAALHKHVIDGHIGSAKDGGTVCLYCKWQDCRDAQASKRFHRRYSIVSHMLVHVPLFQFCCKECGRDFKRRPDLNKHMPLCRKLNQDEAGEVLYWSKTEVAEWLRSLGIRDLGALPEQFMDHDIDGRLLLTKVTHSFLKNQLGVGSSGVREAVLNALDDLRRSQKALAMQPQYPDRSPSQVHSPATHPSKAPAASNSRAGPQASTVSVPNYNRVSPGSEGMLSPGYSLDFALGSPLAHPLAMPTQANMGQLGPGLSVDEHMGLGLGLGPDTQSPLLDVLGADFLDSEPALADLGSLPGLLGAAGPGSWASAGSSQGGLGLEGLDAGLQRLSSKRLAEHFLQDLTAVETQQARGWDPADLSSVLGGYSQAELDALSSSMVSLLTGIQSEIHRKRSRPAFHPYKRGSSHSTATSQLAFDPMPHMPDLQARPRPPHVVPATPLGPVGQALAGGQDDFTLHYEAYLARTGQQPQQWPQQPRPTMPPMPPPGYPFPGVEAGAHHYGMAHRSLPRTPAQTAQAPPPAGPDASDAAVRPTASPAPEDAEQGQGQALEQGPAKGAELNPPTPETMAGVYSAFGHVPEGQASHWDPATVQLFAAAPDTCADEQTFQAILAQPPPPLSARPQMRTPAMPPPNDTVPDNSQQHPEEDGLCTAMGQLQVEGDGAELAVLCRQYLLVERLALALSYFGDCKLPQPPGPTAPHQPPITT